jgi:DUF2934 family protein
LKVVAAGGDSKPSGPHMEKPPSKIDDAEAKRRLIAEIAYFTAERRGFTPGFELDDWLEAEQEVESSLEPPGR